MPSSGKGVKDTSWVPPTVLDRSVGDMLRQTLFEKPAISQVKPGLGQHAALHG